jgi:DNA-binding LacI/PurR family transcriptional regulator
MRELLTGPLPTAIFVANDQMAFGVLRALREARVEVPGDISLVGFDDVPEAAYFSPPLTTVRQDFQKVGKRTFDLLRAQIDGERRGIARSIVEPDLVVRESSCPPRCPGPPN